MVMGATNKSVDVIREKLLPGTYLVENFKKLVSETDLASAMLNSFK